MLWSLVKAIGMEWPMEEEESPLMSMLDMSWSIVGVFFVRLGGNYYSVKIWPGRMELCMEDVFKCSIDGGSGNGAV